MGRGSMAFVHCVNPIWIKTCIFLIKLYFVKKIGNMVALTFYSSLLFFFLFFHFKFSLWFFSFMTMYLCLYMSIQQVLNIQTLVLGYEMEKSTLFVAMCNSYGGKKNCLDFLKVIWIHKSIVVWFLYRKHVQAKD